MTEQGSHHELLNRPNGVYSRLWQAQQQVDLLSGKSGDARADAETARSTEDRRQLTEHSSS